VIIGPRTGSRTEDFHIPDSLPPGLDDLKVIAVDTLRVDSAIALEQDGHIQIWREVLETDWDIVEKIESGEPIWVQSQDKHYWAGWPDKTALENWLSRLSLM